MIRNTEHGTRNTNLYAVIIAGGRGKRFWPHSRLKRPKYFLKLPGQKNTLLQHVVTRLKGLVDKKNIYVVTNKLHYSQVRAQLPALNKSNIIAEPLMKNTAAAIGLAATIIRKKDPNAVIIATPADHIIHDENKFKSILKSAVNIAISKDAIVVLGLKPTYPATAFGYIKPGRKISPNVFKVSKFIEKPNLKKAKQFIKNKNFFWNGGIFVMKADTILNEINRYIPRLSRALRSLEIDRGLASINKLARHYKKLSDISIDYGVMEKSKKTYVIKAPIKWHDVGSWKNLYDIIKADKNGNIKIGTSTGIDTKNSIIITDRDHIVATVGIEDAVVIHTKDATLVCKKTKSQAVKDLVNKIEKSGLGKFV